MYMLLLSRFFCRIFIVTGVVLCSYATLSAQTVIGGDTVDQSAVLDIQDTARGVLLPRLTTLQRNAISNPARGLLIFNSTENRIQVNEGIPETPSWVDLAPLPGTGNQNGNILYWNGSSWTRLAPGLPGQLMSLSPEGFPVWTGAALASLTTNPATSITSTSAIVSGNISADGGANISARGIVWGTTTNPTLSASVLNLSSGTGAFSGTLSGLSPNTTYYIRAFATNNAGTAYGNQQSFSTLSVTVPVLSTSSIVSIAQTTALGGGNITFDGGSVVTARGVVWATSANPTLSDNKTSDGTGEGTYSSYLTRLTAGTTYYVRAYATNITGTTYGNELAFIFMSVQNQCGAYTAPGIWKQFMCYNLGASNPSADPFTPSWEINGGYWQWGRKEMAAPGPSGPGADEANAGSILGWKLLNDNDTPYGSWRYAEKTNNDPCPAGYRVPTIVQWQGVIDNNVVSDVGSSWTSSNTNYTTGKRFGNYLFLPAAGFRGGYGGYLFGRGSYGLYWSSSDRDYYYVWFPDPDSGGAASLDFDFEPGASKSFGFSIRCIEE